MKGRLRRFWKSELARNWLALGLPLGMLSLMPVLATYRLNAYQVSVQDLVLPVTVALLVAGFVTAVFHKLWSRSRFGGLVAAALATMLLTNNYESRFQTAYTLIGLANPFGSLQGAEGLLYSLIFAGAIVLACRRIGAYLAGRKAIKKNSRDWSVALMIAVSAAFGFQVLPAIRFIALAWPQYFYQPPRLAALPDSAKSAAKPDIYYIVLDRYASQSVLKQQFGYGNDDFVQYLEANGFYTNPTARSNYPYTTMSVASTLSASYHDDLVARFSEQKAQTIIPYHRVIQAAPVVSALQSLGYRYIGIGNWYDANSSSASAQEYYQDQGTLTVFGRRVVIGNFSHNQFMAGLFYRLANPGLRLGGFTFLGYSGYSREAELPAQLKRLTKLANQPAGGRFIYAHLLAPHDPYYFRADGSRSAYIENDDVGEPIKQKYLGQLIHINTQMKQILGTINEKSGGKALVILQSDEGPYPMQLNDMVFDNQKLDAELNSEDMRKWSDQNLAMKYGILSAYHLPGVETEQYQNSANPVNIFRLILAHYFGGNLPPLPSCYYAYPDGRVQPFVYEDITHRLSGRPNPACARNGTSPVQAD